MSIREFLVVTTTLELAYGYQAATCAVSPSTSVMVAVAGFGCSFTPLSRIEVGLVSTVRSSESVEAWKASSARGTPGTAGRLAGR